MSRALPYLRLLSRTMLSGLLLIPVKYPSPVSNHFCLSHPKLSALGSEANDGVSKTDRLNLKLKGERERRRRRKLLTFRCVYQTARHKKNFKFGSICRLQGWASVLFICSETRSQTVALASLGGNEPPASTFRCWGPKRAPPYSAPRR